MKKHMLSIMLLLILGACTLNPTVEEQEKSQAILEEVRQELADVRQIKMALAEQDTAVKKIILQQLQKEEEQ